MHIPWEGGCEQVNAINQGNSRPNNNYNPSSNTYNPGLRDHPNFSWRNNKNNNQNQGNQGGQYQNRGNYQNQGYNQNRGNQNTRNNANAGNAQPGSNIEKMLETFMQSQKQECKSSRTGWRCSRLKTSFWRRKLHNKPRLSLDQPVLSPQNRTLRRWKQWDTHSEVGPHGRTPPHAQCWGGDWWRNHCWRRGTR
jgi:hypothetical protein